MRRLLALLLTACTLTTPAWAAPTACHTLTDPVGDTGNLVYGIPDDASDIESIDVTSTSSSLTATVNVVGQPGEDLPGRGHRYEVYFGTGEVRYALRASLGYGLARYELILNTYQDAAGAATGETWRPIAGAVGRIGQRSVTITAPLNRQFPIGGRRVDVFGRTWITFTDGIEVPTMSPSSGAAGTFDGTETVKYRVGDAGCR